NVVLNIKDLRVRAHSNEKRKLTLKAATPGEVTAGMIECPADMEIINKDLVICTLDKGAKLNMELWVESGKGYVRAAQNRPTDAPIGLISVDVLFSTVRKVAYKVENTRVGQITDYDKLILILVTVGTITPEDAVAFAARILQD